MASTPARLTVLLAPSAALLCLSGSSPPVTSPPHERSVELDVELGLGPAACTVLGADRSHEYISENADYRS